jgi:cation diffusion facilitator family transporter
VAVACKHCYWCAKHVGGINLWANFGLFAVKLLGGIFGRSQALIADAVHSMSDVVVSALVLVSLKVSNSPPDEDHRWGHGQIEFIVSAIIGALLVCAAVTITVVSLASIAEGVEYDPGILAVWAAAISVVANEVMFRHSICVGEQMASPAMIANAWENRADVYSSLAALLGVFGARMGFTYLDPVAAIVVGFMIARSGISTLMLGVRGMTDRAFDRSMLARVKKLVMEQEQVKGVSRLRARKLGQKSWVDIEVQFDPQIKVSEAKKIIDTLKKNVKVRFDEIAEVVIVSSVSEPELRET